MKSFTRLFLPVLFALGTSLTLAQGTTIGGTAMEGEASPGFMGMFAGDLYDNFRNMQRFTPTSVMQPGADTWELGDNSDTLEFSGEFLGEETSLEDFLALSNTSALLVIKGDKVIYEHYAHGDSVDSLHMSFSVAKSFVATLVGIAVEEGLIKSIDEPIRTYLPQLTSKTWDGVTIRHVLQMSSGVRFDENYTDPKSDINKMGVLMQTMSYLDYINTLEREHAPGTFNHYASINTQLLGILLVEVTGKTLTEYMQEKLWQPVGMEHEGYWTLDGQGYELAMGGMAASARDYARLGLLYLHGGRRGDAQIVPAGWVKAAVTPDAPHLMPGDNPASSNPSGYGFQWWTPRDPDGDFLARGIWGQNIYVHPANEVVIVKLAADAKNFQQDYKLAYIDYLQDLAQSLR